MTQQTLATGVMTSPALSPDGAVFYRLAAAEAGLPTGDIATFDVFHVGAHDGTIQQLPLTGCNRTEWIKYGSQGRPRRHPADPVVPTRSLVTTSCQDPSLQSRDRVLVEIATGALVGPFLEAVGPHATIAIRDFICTSHWSSPNQQTLRCRDPSAAWTVVLSVPDAAGHRFLARGVLAVDHPGATSTLVYERNTQLGTLGLSGHAIDAAWSTVGEDLFVSWRSGTTTTVARALPSGPTTLALAGAVDAWDEPADAGDEFSSVEEWHAQIAVSRDGAHLVTRRGVMGLGSAPGYELWLHDLATGQAQTIALDTTDMIDVDELPRGIEHTRDYVLYSPRGGDAFAAGLHLLDLNAGTDAELVSHGVTYKGRIAYPGGPTLDSHLFGMRTSWEPIRRWDFESQIVTGLGLGAQPPVWRWYVADDETSVVWFSFDPYYVIGDGPWEGTWSRASLTAAGDIVGSGHALLEYATYSGVVGDSCVVVEANGPAPVAFLDTWLRDIVRVCWK